MRRTCPLLEETQTNAAVAARGKPKSLTGNTVWTAEFLDFCNISRVFIFYFNHHFISIQTEGKFRKASIVGSKTREMQRTVDAIALKLVHQLS